MCFDKELLKPFNQCKHTHIELYSKRLFALSGYYILAHQDKESRQRLVILDSSDSRPIAGLLLDNLGKRSGYVIKGVYTVSERRKQGFAKLLLRTARQYLGEVRHSEDLTKDGLAWRNACEGIS